ncbi:citrate synthase [Rubeoparvulum massiliense]|uniref:citrate synthase n=1 Tax=Rubeoparvulum massiliense TaxID=1631346 RepID=UPI00065E1E2E|nr:citrate synthase [Rubeoparvulum massiliense]
MSTRGLEGVVATQSAVCSIIDGVLTYRGYEIDDLTENATFEEVVYLLWHGKLPNKEELEVFTSQLRQNAALPDEVLKLLRSLPLQNVHPMAVLRTVVSSLGLYDDEEPIMTTEANQRKALRLMAQTPTIVAAFQRLRSGEEPVAPHPDYSFSKNFLYMLKGVEPSAVEVETFDKAMILHADHELNASTFAGRVTVATLSDIYSGVTSAIGALKGPLHGGANEAVMKMLMEIGEVENVEPYIMKKLENKEKIMGFGHRVYKNGDPRAKHLRKMSEALTKGTTNEKYYVMSRKVEELVVSEKGLLPNVDFYSATSYHSLGIPHDLFTPIFAISRMSGWTAHILEQYENNRLIRPRAEYIGESNQRYVSIEER